MLLSILFCHAMPLRYAMLPHAMPLRYFLDNNVFGVFSSKM